MGRNSSLVMTLFFSGLLLTGIGLLVSKWMDADSAHSPALARAEKIADPVFILKKYLTQKEKLEKKTPLRALESLETGADGEALLEFPSAFRVRVMANSQVTLDQDGDKSVLFIKAGDIQIENFGQDGSLVLSKGGQRWSANDYEQNRRAAIESPPPANRELMTEGLTPSYILDALKAQKGIFYRCYTQLLQRRPGATGETSISITIEPNGKTSRAEVTSTKLQDATFKRCLIEAANRIDFKPFAGEAITTVFPLKFE